MIVDLFDVRNRLIGLYMYVVETLVGHDQECLFPPNV